MIGHKQVVAVIRIRNESQKPEPTKITLHCSAPGGAATGLPARTKAYIIKDSATISIVYPMGDHPLLWDEFHPHLYSMRVSIANSAGVRDRKHISFGMRRFSTSGTQLPERDFPIGNGIFAGKIDVPLREIRRPSRLTVQVSVAGYSNSWEIFVYPDSLPAAGGILVTRKMDAHAMEVLDHGGKVLLTLEKGALRPEKGGDIAMGFSSIFWNTAWTGRQPPVTLGILCNPNHPALREFPTEYYSNVEWWDAMTHGNVIRLDSVSPGLQPIVRVIDDWVTANSLGLIFECKVGRGKLLVSGIDLLTDSRTRPEARQLLFSLTKYMSGDAFHPVVAVAAGKIKALSAISP